MAQMFEDLDNTAVAVKDVDFGKLWRCIVI